MSARAESNDNDDDDDDEEVHKLMNFQVVSPFLHEVHSKIYDYGDEDDHNIYDITFCEKLWFRQYRYPVIIPGNIRLSTEHYEILTPKEHVTFPFGI